MQRILGAHGVVIVRPKSETAPLVPGAEPVMGEGATEDKVVAPAPTERTIDTEYLWVFGAYDSRWGNQYAAGEEIDPASYSPTCSPSTAATGTAPHRPRTRRCGTSSARPCSSA